MNPLQHEGCEPRRYAGQLPASIARATKCCLGIDAGLSGSASSGSSGGAVQFGSVTIGTTGGSSGGSSSTWMVAAIGAAIAIVLVLLFRKK